MNIPAKEQQALARWRPGVRWYHPAMARIVIATSRLVTRRINHLHIQGAAIFEQALQRSGRGLLTISNHVSLFDDPLLIANLVHGPYQDVRWVGADALNFFGSAPKSWLFTAGKSVPIVRGMGVDQPGMHFLRDRLRAGEWVHMFPEGGRTRDPDAQMAQTFKPGIGWLIAETQPVVVPFYHYGMHHVLPVGAIRPRTGRSVRVVFGPQIDCNAEWIDRIGRRGSDELTSSMLWEVISAEMRTAIAAIERLVHPAFAARETPA